MPTKRKRRLKASVAMEWECLLEDVLISKMTERTAVVYAISDGEFGDLATNIQRRVAWFNGAKAWEGKDLKAELTKAKAMDNYYFEGLPGAFYDDVIEDKQEADEAAEQHRHQEQLLSDEDRASGWHQQKLRDEQELYGNFMDAVDLLADNDENEEAWAAIEAWRNRLALEHEK